MEFQIAKVLCKLFWISILFLSCFNCIKCDHPSERNIKFESQSQQEVEIYNSIKEHAVSHKKDSLNKPGGVLPLSTHDFESSEMCLDENCLGNYVPKRQTEDSLDFKMPPGWIDPFDMSLDQDQTDWVDPFDMTPLKTQPPSFHSGTCNDKYLSYLQRFISIFIQSVNCENIGSVSGPSSMYSANNLNCKQDFLTSGKDFNILKQFSNEGLKEVTIEMVSDALARITSHRSSNEGPNYFMRWLNFQFIWNKAIKKISQLVSSPEWTVVSSVLIMFISTLWFTHAHSYRLALFTLFFTVFFGGFGVTWLRMYQEKEVERYVSMIDHGNVPYHCNGNVIAWYEHLYYSTFGTSCYDFYKTRDVNPILKISPTDVLSETISSMLVNPAANFGKAYGSFIESVTASAPFLLKPIAIIMGFIVPMFLTVVLLCFLFGYGVTISPLFLCLKPSINLRRTSTEKTFTAEEKYIEDISKKKTCEEGKNWSTSSLKSLLTDSNQPIFLITNTSGLKECTSAKIETTEKNELVRQSSQAMDLNEGIEETAEYNPNKRKPNISSSSESETVVYRAIKISDEKGIEEELLSISLSEDNIENKNQRLS